MINPNDAITKAYEYQEEYENNRKIHTNVILRCYIQLSQYSNKLGLYESEDLLPLEFIIKGMDDIKSALDANQDHCNYEGFVLMVDDSTNWYETKNKEDFLKECEAYFQ